MKTYTVLAAHTQQQVEDHQCDEVKDLDTLKEAKAHARHCLTDEFQRLNEMSAPLGYAKVVCDGVCLADYFRKAAA